VKFITRTAPGVESNLGEEIEAVFNEGDIVIVSFTNITGGT
jgi:hypothetical protein